MKRGLPTELDLCRYYECVYRSLALPNHNIPYHIYIARVALLFQSMHVNAYDVIQGKIQMSASWYSQMLDHLIIHMFA